jgi:hypothetical protein
MRWLICVTIPAALLMVLSAACPLHAQSNDDPNIRAMARQADFIFKGIVVEVGYRNSEFVQLLDSTGAPIYENGQPVYADGSNLPYSFVTCRIMEVYKGKPPEIRGVPSEVVTLQMLGGIDQSDPNNDIFFVSEYPHMDVGDTDVLFVLGNTIRPCPLVGSERGRFRVITDPEDNEPKMYNDIGRELLHVPENEEQLDQIAFGRIHRYPEVMMYHFGDCEGCTLEKVYVDDGDEHSDPGGQGDPPPEEEPLGPQFGELEFGSFVVEVVQQTHTQEELDRLPPVVSADIGVSFEVESFNDDGPEDFGPEVPPVYPRPWLDELPQEEKDAILEAEWVEGMLLELSGGNPVLPENECEMKILIEGALVGDISGPQGKPDCYVNFFDLAAMAGLWLECNNPEDPSCL